MQRLGWMAALSCEVSDSCWDQGHVFDAQEAFLPCFHFIFWTFWFSADFGTCAKSSLSLEMFS